MLVLLLLLMVIAPLEPPLPRASMLPLHRDAVSDDDTRSTADAAAAAALRPLVEPLR